METTEYPETTTNRADDSKQKKFEWYWSPVFCGVWFTLFYVAVIPSFYSYPETLRIRDEHLHVDQFIGERAQIQLRHLSNIGVKLSGTVENEVQAVNFLLAEIQKIQEASRKDLYDIEVDVQYSSGKFMLWRMATSYHNVSNVIVKISPKNSKSESYLLVNSHYDSEVDSPAAADAGIMIVVMLETLRVISRSEKPLRNPVVFLLNGAEESNLLAAHGFITQHKWAPFCKALINLDSAGSGGREVLFQSGPDHPWLMKYYKASVLHPFASTVAEELFQNNFIPSDTDFRIFRDYGGVPGLDMAHTLNGYIYHTKYDNFVNLERGTYQTTGDNVLALTWALANAYELENPELYSEGHTVFTDFLGWFLITYTESTGIVINIVVSVSALVIIAASVFMMSRKKDEFEFKKSVWIRFAIIFGIQLITIGAATGVCMLMAVLMPAFGLSQSWYSAEWLIFGLYFCPLVAVLGIIPAFFIHFTKNKTSMSLNDTIACFMHSHCIVLVFVCLLMTGLSIRSAFFVIFAIGFYAVSVVVNLLTGLFIKHDLFVPIHLVFQLLPYWFYTYQMFTSFKTFIPMQGRDGPTSKPEILIAFFTAEMTLFFAGFIVPILLKFRKSKILFSIFAGLTVVFVIIAATPAGFPYKAEVAPQRFYVLHTNRVIYDVGEQIVRNESGFYIQPVDTRPKTLQDTTFKNAAPASWIKEACDTQMYCGLPLYNTRWLSWKDSAYWIPAEAPAIVVPTELELTAKKLIATDSIRYSFSLKAADRIVIYVEGSTGDAEIVNWSFDRTVLEDDKYQAPYFAYHMYSMDDSPLEFWVDVQTPGIAMDVDKPNIRLGVGGHLLYHRHTYTTEYKDFLKTFPDWVYPIHWVASYRGWTF